MFRKVLSAGRRCSKARAGAVSTFSSAAKKYDVVCVGGGAIGSSIADSLLRADPSLSVCVIERDPTYSFASSALSVGSIRQQFSLAENVRISQYGVEFIKELSLDEECSVQFDPGGYAFLASSEAGADQLRKNVHVQRENGADIKLFGGGAAFREHFPWCQTDDIVEATLGSPGQEGWFDPFTLTTVLRRRAAERGAIFVHGEARAIRTRHQGGGNSNVVESIVYEGADGNIGEISCGHTMVNAAGCWSKGVLELALAGEGQSSCSSASGSDTAEVLLPVVPRKRNVFVVHCATPLMPGVPLLCDPSGFYVRREGDAERGLFLVGGMESARTSDPDCEGHKDELAVDHALWEDHLWPALAERIPAFEACKVQSSWAGFYDYNTFDQNALLGLVPGFDNLQVATGFSGHGIQQAPAVGRAIAERIVFGEERSLDLSAFEVSRVADNRPIFEQNIV